MEWLDPAEIEPGECVIRLEQEVIKHATRSEQAFWWGKSIHQIAYVTSAGAVMAQGRAVDRQGINGWMRLPQGARQK